MFEICQAKEIRQTMQSEIFVNWIISYHLPRVYCARSKISVLQDVIALYIYSEWSGLEVLGLFIGPLVCYWLILRRECCTVTQS